MGNYPCKSEITLAVADSGAAHLYRYNGLYKMDVTRSNGLWPLMIGDTPVTTQVGLEPVMPTPAWWESEDGNAIWMGDDLKWRVGPLEDKGTDLGDIMESTVTGTACPYQYVAEPYTKVGDPHDGAEINPYPCALQSDWTMGCDGKTYGPSEWKYKASNDEWVDSDAIYTVTADDCSWSYGEWSEWTNFGLGARSRVQTMPDGKCDPVSLVEDEEAVCRGSKLPLHCDENQFIEVTAVNYGTTNKCFCTSPDDEDCLANVLEDIQGHCNNRYSCELQDTDSVWEHFSGRSSECKKGFHLVPGDYPGWGQLGSYTNIEDTEKCGSLCQSTAGCLSYEFSTSERKCNLNSAIAPSQGIYKDYAFCVADEGFRVYESEVILDVSYNCLESYVPYPETACSSEITLSDAGKKDGLTHLNEYFSTYTSQLKLDENDLPWWENGDYAIWKNDGTWIVGLLADIGTEKGVMKMDSDSPCPHPFGLNRTDVGWTYYQENLNWKEADPLDILLLIGPCDSVCEEARKNAEEKVITVVNFMNREAEKKMASNAEDIETLYGLLREHYDENLQVNPNAWQEAMKPVTDASWKELGGDPLAMKEDLYWRVDELIMKKQISTGQAEKLKKSIDDSLSFGSSAPATWTDMRVAMENSLALAIAEKRKENGELDTKWQQAKFYGSETVRRLQGTTYPERAAMVGQSAAYVYSAVGKFQKGDAVNVVSGVLDITNAVAQGLPPPISIYTETFSGILGMFMPGAGGPSNQAVIDEVKAGFEEQKEFITEKFEEQKQFIQAELKKAIDQIERYISYEHMVQIQSQSNAVLEYIQEKQAYLFNVKEEHITEDELTRITSDLQIMDNTKDTSIIRQLFLSDCVGNEGAITNNRIQHFSEEVKICLLILYNYLTIEKYRYELLARFLGLRNMVPDNTGVTAGYWDVVKTRNATVMEFIQTIEADTVGASTTSHTLWTGRKIRCYIAGDGEYLPTDNTFTDGQRSEIQEYIKSVMGSSYSYTDEPCSLYGKMFPTYAPISGPQTAVEITEVENGNWVECHKRDMNDELTDSDIDDTIQKDCFRDHIMMACKEASSTYLEVLAWASRDEVFQVTDVADCGTDGDVAYSIGHGKWEGCEGRLAINCKYVRWSTQATASCNSLQCQRDQCNLDNGILDDRCYICSCNDGGICSGSIDNGVKWYRVEGGRGTWGFAQMASTINLNWVDVASGSNEKRLSMHVNANDAGWKGGHRCGSTKASYEEDAGIDDENWELVFYHTDVPQ